MCQNTVCIYCSCCWSFDWQCFSQHEFIVIIRECTRLFIIIIWGWTQYHYIFHYHYLRVNSISLYCSLSLGYSRVNSFSLYYSLSPNMIMNDSVFILCLIFVLLACIFTCVIWGVKMLSVLLLFLAFNELHLSKITLWPKMNRAFF